MTSLSVVMSLIAEGCCAVCTNQIAISQSYPDTPIAVCSILTAVSHPDTARTKRNFYFGA